MLDDSLPRQSRSKTKTSAIVIRVTRQEQLAGVLKAVDYIEEHSIVPTRANTTSVAKRFAIRPRLLEQAMRIMAEEDFNA